MAEWKSNRGEIVKLATAFREEKSAGVRVFASRHSLRIQKKIESDHSPLHLAHRPNNPECFIIPCENPFNGHPEKRKHYSAAESTGDINLPDHDVSTWNKEFCKLRPPYCASKKRFTHPEHQSFDRSCEAIISFIKQFHGSDSDKEQPFEMFSHCHADSETDWKFH